MAPSTGPCSKPIRDGREAHAAARAVVLPSVITSPADLRAFEQQRATPNFITGKRARGERVEVRAGSPPNLDVAGKIVLIVNADPGFDWIFAQPIVGLITKYGGVNSHMAIRCAEFGIPAAIGCGEQRFELLVNADQVMLDCSASVIQTLH